MNDCSFSVEASKKDCFRLTRLIIKGSSIPASFSAFRICQLSDFHLGRATSYGHVEEAIALASQLAPDLVLLTGDYLQVTPFDFRRYFLKLCGPRAVNWVARRRAARPYAKLLARALEGFSAPEGIIGVFGNHDHFEGLRTILFYTKDKVCWLRNSSAFITRGEDCLQIAGIEDLRRGHADVQKAFSLNGQSSKQVSPFFRLLLSHNPDIVLRADFREQKEINLVLCGHTHGGQICFPNGEPITTHTRQRAHVSGLSFTGHTAVYVNTGIGYGGIPLRLNCPPEITLIEFSC